jgi:hypothetical protein
MNQPQMPQQTPTQSRLGLSAFIVALIGFLVGIIPFAGFVGTVGLVLGVVDLQRARAGQPRPTGFAIAGVVLGALATLGAVAWVIAVVAFEQAAKKGSCPHLYSYDGEAYRLDADLASGALYKAAEKDDLDRLESLRPVDGQYRVRLQNDLEEVDNIDALSLVVADADPDVEVLPTQTGDIVGVRGAAKPLETSRERIDARERWSLTFARPVGDRAHLVIRGRNTAFAETAFVEYMAKMGQGVRPLMEYRGDTGGDCVCYRKYIEAEIDRLGLPLWIAVSSSGGTPSRLTLQPVGPAIARSQALAIDLPPASGDRVVVRLEATPRFWELDEILLAPIDPASETIATTTLAPRAATAPDGADALSLLAEIDATRVVIRPGEHVDVRFDAPPAAPGKTRTVVARLRGYYDLDIGGPKGVNVAQMIAHRLGLVSLPRYAETLTVAP